MGVRREIMYLVRPILLADLPRRSAATLSYLARPTAVGVALRILLIPPSSPSTLLLPSSHPRSLVHDRQPLSGLLPLRCVNLYFFYILVGSSFFIHSRDSLFLFYYFTTIYLFGTLRSQVRDSWPFLLQHHHEQRPRSSIRETKIILLYQYQTRTAVESPHTSCQVCSLWRRLPSIL